MRRTERVIDKARFLSLLESCETPESPDYLEVGAVLQAVGECTLDWLRPALRTRPYLGQLERAVERGERARRDGTRYARNKGELAVALGVCRKTLDSWERSGVVALERVRAPARGYALESVLEGLKYFLETY